MWGNTSLLVRVTPFARMKTEISVEYLRECFTYNPEEGTFIWKIRPREHFKSEDRWKTMNKRCAGKIAGGPTHHGYILIGVGRERHLAHRLAWVMSTGKWPDDTIDHINGNPSDNRLSNLRQASFLENTHNTRIRSNNTSGAKGVYKGPVSGRWRTYINKHKKRFFFGVYENYEDAVAVVREAREKLHGEFANHG